MAFIIAVSWFVNGISIPCSTVNSTISILGENSLIKKKIKNFFLVEKLNYLFSSEEFSWLNKSVRLTVECTEP